MQQKAFKPKKSRAIVLMTVAALLFLIPVVLMMNASSGEDASGAFAAVVMWPLALIFGLIGLYRYVKSTTSSQVALVEISPQVRENLKKKIVKG